MQRDMQDPARPVNVAAQQCQGTEDAFRAFLLPELRPFNQSPIDLLTARRLMDLMSAAKQGVTVPTVRSVITDITASRGFVMVALGPLCLSERRSVCRKTKSAKAV